MEFHEKLQELRKSRGLTQEELAEALFVSRTAISKWESGRGYPSIDSLKEISRYFSVSIDELLSGDQLVLIAEKENKSNLNGLYSFDIVLQNELTLGENIELAREFCREQFVARGMIVELAVHERKSKNEDEPDNPHFHVLASIRTIAEDAPAGRWCKGTCGLFRLPSIG